jgi:hypothetical protein
MAVDDSFCGAVPPYLSKQSVTTNEKGFVKTAGNFSDIRGLFL